MTEHRIKISDHWAWLLYRGVKTCELRYDDRDYQTGDTVVFLHSDTGSRIEWMPSRTITHVLKNIAGLTAGWVVLSFNDPDLDYYRSEAKSQLAVTESQARTIAALRGQITKQRNKIAALTEQGGNQ